MSAEMEIRAALLKLDAKNDDHWTEDGLPRIDALGLPKGLATRSAVTAAAPQFTRANPSVEMPDPAKPEEQLQTPKPLAVTDPVLTAPLAPKPSVEQEAAEQAELEAAIAELQEQVTSHQAAKAAVESQLDAAQKRLDVLLILKMRQRSHEKENMAGIRAVLERGKLERAAKAEMAQELRQVGITAKLLQGKAPIDAAMARKGGFGLTRPNFTARG
jgi:hypothetical protein